MMLHRYLSSRSGALANANFLIVANIGLVFLVFFLSFSFVNKSDRIVYSNQFLGPDSWVTDRAASESYLKSWGLYFADLVGNVTPATVNFQIETIKLFLAPSVYSKIVDAMNQQARSIKEDGVVLRFEVRGTMYERSTKRVFITGFRFSKGVGGNETREPATYEFLMSIANYAPSIEAMDTYVGEPHDETYEAAQEAKRSKK